MSKNDLTARVSGVIISCTMLHADELTDEETEQFTSEYIDPLGYGIMDEHWRERGVDYTFSEVAGKSTEIIRRDVEEAVNLWIAGKKPEKIRG